MFEEGKTSSLLRNDYDNLSPTDQAQLKVDIGKLNDDFYRNENVKRGRTYDETAVADYCIDMMDKLLEYNFVTSIEFIAR